jgi:hypothetical protein
LALVASLMLEILDSYVSSMRLIASPQRSLKLLLEATSNSSERFLRPKFFSPPQKARQQTSARHSAPAAARAAPWRLIPGPLQAATRPLYIRRWTQIQARGSCFCALFQKNEGLILIFLEFGASACGSPGGSFLGRMSDTLENEPVKVAVRVRPLSDHEKSLSAIQSLKVEGDSRLRAFHAENSFKDDRIFTFDHVFGTNSRREDLHRDVGSPLVEAVLQGCDACLFAYGALRFPTRVFVDLSATPFLARCLHSVCGTSSCISWC